MREQGRVKILETERLVVRTWEPADVDAAIPIYGDPKVMEYWPAPETPDQVAARVKRFIERQAEQGMTLWLLERKSDGRQIGHAGYQLLAGGPDIEIGWLLASDCWGRGYATEAARGCMAHAFANRPIERLVAIVQAVNVRSVAVAKRLGMTFERVGVWHGFEHELYAIGRARAMKVLDLSTS